MMDAATGRPRQGPLSGAPASRFRRALAVALPVVGLSSVMLLLSVYRISPSSSVDGSSGNPLGILTSNFVYDGSVNVENVVASSAFLFVVFMYLPSTIRTFSAYLLPLVAVVVGGFAQLTAISSAYVVPRVCGASCSFYGMSGVSNATIGFTLASFVACVGLASLQSRGRLVATESQMLQLKGFRNRLVLAGAFVAYLCVLLLFAGLLTLPFRHPTVSGPGGQTISVPPPAILTQPPPTALVHAASVTYGFVFCVLILVVVNRRYRVFVRPGRAGIVPAGTLATGGA